MAVNMEWFKINLGTLIIISCLFVFFQKIILEIYSFENEINRHIVRTQMDIEEIKHIIKNNK